MTSVEFELLLRILVVKAIISEDEYDEIMSRKGYHIAEYIENMMERVYGV